MKVISDDSLKRIANVFIGDDETLYQRKSGPVIYDFFNKYFGFNDQYWSKETVKPSRWIMVIERIKILINQNKIDSFFNVILSTRYLHTENRELGEVELAIKSKKICDSFNEILENDDLKIHKINSSYKLMSKNEDLEFIGFGGFANVYKIKSQNIILKKLKEDLLIDDGIVSRFKREYTITKSLSDIPGIIRVFDYDEKDVSYTMEIAESDLEKFIINNRYITEEQRIKIIRQVFYVMEQVHLRNIIHRDISPSNILLFSGQFKISDFGLGKDLSIFHSHQSNYTNSFGRFSYCDPRQFMQLKEGDKLSDIYSIGRLLNFIFTGNPMSFNHKYSAIAEKATAGSESSRYQSIGDMNKAFMKVYDFYNDQDAIGKINEKISLHQIDEAVISYILNLDSKKLFKRLSDSRFLAVFSDVIMLKEHTSNLHRIFDGLYNECKFSGDKKFEDFDNVGYLCIFVISSKFDFLIKENAVNILNHIMVDVNRFNVIRQVEKAVQNGIDPFIEELLDKTKFETY